MSSLHKLYAGWFNQAWRKEDQDERVIQLQKYFIGILCVLCSAFFFGWLTAPNRLTVYIPPDIHNGATLKAGSIPEPLIYSFAYEVWQEVNYWAQNGEEDYLKNIHAYSPYFTPKFKAELLDNCTDLKSGGQLQRIRYLQGLSGAAFDLQNIKKLSDDTWEVDLRMRLTEFNNNQPVKDVEILYPLKVIRTNVSPRSNPFGLQLDGFISPEHRTKTYI